MSSPTSAAPHVLEWIVRTHQPSDANERHAEVGRLILAADALHYVQGWENTSSTRNSYTPLVVFDYLINRLVPPHRWPEGVRLLGEVEALAPARQVLAMSGSVTVPVADIEVARLGPLLGDLKVITESRGEVLTFQIPYRRRADVKVWLAGLPRR